MVVIGIGGKAGTRTGKVARVYRVIYIISYSLDNIYLDYYPRLAEKGKKVLDYCAIGRDESRLLGN